MFSRVTQASLHPAIPTLFRCHLHSRIRRIRRAFSSPRRIALSLVVVALIVLWLGQTIASVLMRDPWAPDVFQRWVSLPLLLYFVWHIVRVAWKRPEEAVEWSPEEEALVVGGPFTRSQILTYRFVVILTATLPKAALTALVLCPDLTWSGPIGLMLALVGLEIFRLIMDLGVSCLSERSYFCFRAAVLAAVACAVTAAYFDSQSQIAVSGIDKAVPLSLTQQTLATAQGLRNGSAIAFLERPFTFLASIISGREPSIVVVAKILATIAVLCGLWRLVIVLDAEWLRRKHRQEKRLWKQRGFNQVGASQNANRSMSLPHVPGSVSFAAVAWRQAKRAWRYAGSLLVSMGIPAMLALLPMYAIPNPMVAFVFVVCGVVFYTFVLLPEAIKFDFRLDADHVTQLRMLPLTSTQLVFGQLSTPVVLACLFQTLVIAWAGFARSVDVSMVLIAIGITLPLTVIFVAIDNLVFLLYPHRPTQEGFEAFLRTILKFTGKSLLLVLAGGTLLVWAPVANVLAHTFASISTAAVFYSGICLAVTAVALLSVRMVVAAWDRYDVSIDVA